MAGSGRVGRCATFQSGGKLVGRTKADASKTGCLPGMPLRVRIKTDLFVNCFSLSGFKLNWMVNNTQNPPLVASTSDVGTSIETSGYESYHVEVSNFLDDHKYTWRIAVHSYSPFS